MRFFLCFAVFCSASADLLQAVESGMAIAEYAECVNAAFLCVEGTTRLA